MQLERIEVFFGSQPTTHQARARWEALVCTAARQTPMDGIRSVEAQSVEETVRAASQQTRQGGE